MKGVLASLVVAATLSACVSVPVERVFHSRMYNLSTGEVITGISRTNRAGQSIITAGPTKSGETFTGEATSIDNRIATSSFGGGRVSTPGVLSDSYIRTSSYSTSTPGYQNGSAILVGSQGTVIDILYRVSLSGIGEGEGQDNNGVKYRLQFSQQL
jgi:hypothetical protein